MLSLPKTGSDLIKMKLINYHLHTKLCGHATGEVEDYIKMAIKKNLAEIGFADHAPWPEKIRTGITMAPEETELYLNLIEKNKKKFADQISIKIGFEVDFPFLPSFNQKYLNDQRIDFIIGSCHIVKGWAFDLPGASQEFAQKNIDQVYQDYYESVEKLVKTRKFDIVGHFDVIKKYGYRSKKDFSAIIDKIARLLAANKMTAEINTSGLLKPVKEIYPSNSILKIFFDRNVPITLGTDAHEPEKIDFYLKETIQKIKKIGFRKISTFSKRKKYELNL